MKWKDKIKEWNEGRFLTYPRTIKKPFFFETSFITSDMNEEYKEKFIQTNKFNKLNNDYRPFINKIVKSKNKYVLSFLNLSKKSLLIIPYPKKNKNFKTLKHFIDNASKLQQTIFWKKVAYSILKMLRKHNKVWISTHGTGVPYFHLRIDTFPKYYLTNNFK